MVGEKKVILRQTEIFKNISKKNLNNEEREKYADLEHFLHWKSLPVI